MKYPGNPAAEGAAAVRADEAARPTFVDRMRELDQALGLALASAQIAHSEARRMYKEAIAKLPADAPDSAQSAAIWGAVQHVGGIVGELSALRSRL